MRNIYLGLIGCLLAWALIGCSSEDDNTQSTNDSSPNENEVEQDNSEEVVDSEETSESISKNTEKSEDQDFLSLGETGEFTTVMGDYELTVNSFEILDEIGEEEPFSEEFLLVHFEVENIGDSPIIGDDINSATLFVDENLGSELVFGIEGVNMLDQTEIQPGEKKEAEIVFDYNASDSYELTFNFGALESNATVLTWKFDREEASNL